MPTRPPSPDPSHAPGTDESSAFSGLGAGMSFFQDWMKAAGSALPNLQGAQAAGGKGATPWGLPTLDPEELDKRIQDLKTVQFWLEQNTRLIGMTIQGLEVQRMTLTTLRGMNVSMDNVRESLKARAAPAESASQADPVVEPRPAAAAPPEEADAATVNPMRWWDTLTQQFGQLANQAVQAAQATGQNAEAAAKAAAAAATTSPPVPAAKRAATAATKVPVKTARQPARKAGAAAAPRRRTPGANSDN